MTSLPPIRVGIDGFNLAMAQGTGVATYARSLAEACAGLGREIDLIYGLNVPLRSAPEQRETLFFAALAEGKSGGEPPARRTLTGQVHRFFLTPSSRRLVEIPVTGRVIRKGVADRVPAFNRLFTLNRLFYLGDRYLRRYGRLLPIRIPDPPAIMHWTYPVPLRLIGSRNVYTIHDLVPLRLPYLSLEDKRYHERLLHACVASAAHILTVSEASRRDILDYLPVPPDKVTNTYQALPQRAPQDRPGDDLGDRLRAIFRLEPQGYFLFLGAIEPKKNVGRLIEACLTAALDMPLIIAGPDAWSAEGELQLLKGQGGASALAEGRIRRLGYVPVDHLDLLVRGARTIVFPSLYEGFGLPALEAMAAGVPVIAGNQGALPEIVGDSALLVDPYDVEALRAALVQLDGDAILRSTLGAAGRARAQDFTLAQYQARIDRIHRQLAAAPVDGRQLRGSPTSMPAMAGE
ncbi:glycosyltransferase family 4 protein [Sphingomonas sp. QA11]|uniref:glycosyltransferase family 4 protein n=1 Tax=Sphingomonas sp. QA11 TaxID=2950605 RepID=UPI00234A160F|nr:glycosyltransferase family 1 protein [Sphingomonas sp. QA11]WCM28045.1 glycosyltransferase family 4 protein [Sphingomonas sp. QA11]